MFIQYLYLTENTLLLHHKNQSVNILFWESYEIYKYTLWTKYRTFHMKPGGMYISNRHSALKRGGGDNQTLKV